jgi:cytochrome c peroxidase
MRYGKLITALAMVAIVGFAACKKTDDTASTTPASNNPGTYTGDILVQNPNLPSTPYNYANPSLPNYLQTPPIQGQDNTPANNQITDAGATLGRVLFYDKNLSYNNTTSCASCHLQTNGFSDVSTLSKGFAGGNTGRNSMGLINARYYPGGKFFWDERASSAEDQALKPIQDHVEMGMNLDSLINKLNSIGYYPALFQNAFGDKTINSEKVAKALAQFVRSIVSYQSKYDIGRANFPANAPPPQLGDFANFTVQENRGKAIFFGPDGGCTPCHGTETFTAKQIENNGLELVTVDSGVGRITGNRADVGKFKVPSLKNIELTAPYMHDGRFATLEEVVEHYSTGVMANPNLSPPLRVGNTPNGQPHNLNLSAEDKAALVAFLKTLTDNTIAGEAKYSSPF